MLDIRYGRTYEKQGRKEKTDKKALSSLSACQEFRISLFRWRLGLSSRRGLLSLFVSLGMEEKVALPLVSASLILLAAVLTALGIFDRAAKRAGAGTLLPVTGFSNAVVSEAMDAASEGLILGVGAKIFTVAGPVILFGTAAGVIYGVIYYVITLIM